MEAIEIKPDVLQFLCEKAEAEGKSITDIIDDVLRSVLGCGSTEQAVRLICHNCKNEIDYEVSESRGYCDYCETVVFFEKC